MNTWLLIPLLVAVTAPQFVLVDLPTERIAAVRAEVASVKPCGPEDEPIVALGLYFNVAFRNVSDRPLVAARGPLESFFGQGAQSAAAGRAGEIKFDIGGLEVYASSEVPPRPGDRDFVVLEPGEEYSARVGTGIFGAREVAVANSTPNALLAGATAAIRMQIRMWPYRPIDWDDVERVREQWKDKGELMVGTVLTDFVEFKVPDLKDAPPCPPISARSR